MQNFISYFSIVLEKLSQLFRGHFLVCPVYFVWPATVCCVNFFVNELLLKTCSLSVCHVQMLKQFLSLFSFILTQPPDQLSSAVQQVFDICAIFTLLSLSSIAQSMPCLRKNKMRWFPVAFLMVGF